MTKTPKNHTRTLRPIHETALQAVIGGGLASIPLGFKAPSYSTDKDILEQRTGISMPTL